MLEIGSVIDGKYKILSEIGRGGMSVVYMAINEKANKTWAIKEVRRDGLLNYEIVRQGLLVETDMLKKLHHPHLVGLADVIEEQDTFLIVMDYIEGVPLSVTLNNSGAQPVELVIDWGKQLCDLLGYLHTQDPPIIYRDMKPANIMLKPDGNLTLIDFGTAREFKQKNVADTTCLGSYGYAAPEQFGGMGQTDGRTDIYGLGATLYHLASGVDPSQEPYEIKPLQEANPSLAGYIVIGLDRIIQKCTKRDPNDRYQSWAEVLYDLEQLGKVDPDVKRKDKKHMRLFAAALAASVVFGIAGLSFSLSATGKATDDYAIAINNAQKETDYNEKINIYRSAIQVPEMAGRPDAYLELIELFKSDYQFSENEKNIIFALVQNNRDALLKDTSNYVDVSFELGKLFWYYYDYGGIEDNRITRMKSAVEWFNDVITFADEDFPHLGMAKVYHDIGRFYRDISINTVEASDKGTYAPLFADLSELVSIVSEDSTENDIVKLELYELCRGALRQYATKFKIDGISENEMLALLDSVENDLNAIEALTEQTETKKADTVALLQETREAIETAFAAKEG